MFVSSDKGEIIEGVSWIVWDWIVRDSRNVLKRDRR
jgi:hypothetical protein